MTDDLIVVGKITRAHGVRGEVSVLVLSETPDRFEPGSVLRLEAGGTLTVERTRLDRGRLLVVFGGIENREAAMKLGGEFLFISSADLPDLPDGSWWPHQIEGCEVLTEEGKSLGVVTEVVNTPANDIWVTREGAAEVLIPALKDVVVSVDVLAKRIVVRELPGLTD